MRLMHSSAPRTHTCSSCPKAFLTAKQLRLHASSHLALRPFACPVCHKTFRNKSNRDIHRRSIHEKEKTFICQYCSSAFFSAQRLKVHITCHTMEKNYKCKDCGKMFGRSSNLQVHSKKHSGIKSAICSVCNKGFFDNGSLKHHMLSHTQEKKHACKYCGVKFVRTYTRNRHQKVVHEKPK